MRIFLRLSSTYMFRLSINLIHVLFIINYNSGWTMVTVSEVNNEPILFQQQQNQHPLSIYQLIHTLLTPSSLWITCQHTQQLWEYTHKEYRKTLAVSLIQQNTLKPKSERIVIKKERDSITYPTRSGRSCTSCGCSCCLTFDNATVTGRRISVDISTGHVLVMLSSSSGFCNGILLSFKKSNKNDCI